MLIPDAITITGLAATVLAVAALPFTKTQRQRMAAFGIGIGSTIAFLSSSSFMAWILRDGLGPDAIASNGLQAFHRYLEGEWPLLVIGVLALFLTMRMNSSARHRIPNAESCGRGYGSPLPFGHQNDMKERTWILGGIIVLLDAGSLWAARQAGDLTTCVLMGIWAICLLGLILNLAACRGQWGFRIPAILMVVAYVAWHGWNWWQFLTNAD